MKNKDIKNKNKISNFIARALIITSATIRKLIFSKKIVGIIGLWLLPIIIFSLWSAGVFVGDKEILYNDEYGDIQWFPQDSIDENIGIDINNDQIRIDPVIMDNDEKALKISISGTTNSDYNYSIHHISVRIFLYVSELYSINLVQFRNNSINGSLPGPFISEDFILRGTGDQGNSDWATWELIWSDPFLAEPLELLETLLTIYQQSQGNSGSGSSPPGNLQDIEDNLANFNIDLDIKNSTRLGFLFIVHRDNSSSLENLSYDYSEIYPIFDGNTVVDYGVVGLDIVEKEIDEDGFKIFMEIFPTILFIFIIPLIGILFAISAVRDDIEDKTIVYLITRPVSKFELLLFKFNGYFFSTWVPIAISMSITFFIVSFTEGTPLLHINYLLVLLGLSILSILAYGAIFFAFAVSLPYPSILSLLYLLFWEITLVPNQPNILNRLSITYHLQSIAKDLLGEVANVNVYQPINVVTSFFVLLGFIIGFFGLAVYLFSYRDFT